MSDENSSIFSKKAQDKLRSPDDLDEYVRVTNPNVWVVLAACACLMIGMFAWGVFGTVTTSVGTVGTCVEGHTVCFLPSEDASKVHVGDVANVAGTLMEVADISPVPVSPAEAREIVGGDYLASTLVSGDWTYVVSFKTDGDVGFQEEIPLPVNITTERIAPISLVFKDI